MLTIKKVTLEVKQEVGVAVLGRGGGGAEGRESQGLLNRIT